MKEIKALKVAVLTVVVLPFTVNPPLIVRSLAKVAFPLSKTVKAVV